MNRALESVLQFFDLPRMCTKNHSLYPFVSDPNLPAINVNVTEGRNNLWSKTKRAFAYMYEHHKDEADWFLKADDDTYTVVENLRYMLQPYDASKPIYFGCKFKPYVSQGYMSGGAGYVLSKEALRRFVKQGTYMCIHILSPHFTKILSNYRIS